MSEKVPYNGVIFTLALKEPIITPRQMLIDDGYNPHLWEFHGEIITKRLTGNFKLFSAGDCANLNEVQRKLYPFGTPAKGQWRTAFKEQYPEIDGRGPIGFPDSSWLDRGKDGRFPMLEQQDNAWLSRFGAAKYKRDRFWRWVVQVA